MSTTGMSLPEEHERSGADEGPPDQGADAPIETPHTGDLAVDEALSRLAEAAGLPLEEQVGTFDAVHRTLQDRLADVEG